MRGLLSALVVFTITFTTAQCIKRRVGCYYNAGAVTRSGKGKYSVDDIPGDLCTHLMYSFVGLSNNQVTLLDPEAYIQNFSNLRAKYPSLKYIATIGGWGEGGLKYSQMVSQNSTREIFIESVIEFLVKYNLDGFDLDWEYPGGTDRDGTPADKDNFMYLVQELRVAFDEAEKGWELSVAAPLTKSRLDAGYHVPELCQACDAMNIMCYDLRGNWDGFSGVNAPLHGSPDEPASYKGVNVYDGMALWEQMGCPANKLVVGVPFYGHTYTLPSVNTNYTIGAPVNSSAGGGDPGPYTNERGVLAYYEICSKLNKESGWTQQWDEYGECPYAYKGLQWMGYDNQTSVAIKMDFIRQKGYLGAMTWAIDLDDFNGLCGEKNPLLKTLYEYMSSDYVPPTMPTIISPPKGVQATKDFEPEYGYYESNDYPAGGNCVIFDKKIK